VSDWTVHTGDCLEVMAGMEANTFDAIVTDPPYGLAFMGKAWDHAVPGPEFFAAMLRVAKPGAHIVAFGGTRLYHRMTCAMEDAGWEIRDCLMWLYGSGFPKSHDVSKAIDREAGAEREVVGVSPHSANRVQSNGSTPFVGVDGEGQRMLTAPATSEAKRWQGWGTALKPAWEPIVLARKPLDGTVAQNHLRHGCGGVNVDGCRVGTEGGERRGDASGSRKSGTPFDVRNWQSVPLNAGRWPANLILDAEAGAGAEWSRFFYCPKASKADRDEGLEGFEERVAGVAYTTMAGDGRENPEILPAVRRNPHPTVKPTDLMRWLARLVTPQGGTILDPFTGSGSTGKAARLEGFGFVGIEREPEYADIARARIAAVEPMLIGGVG
jgi:DNA modification methylase